MKSLISRESHRPEKRYSGVYHIQGGMVTDADLDERSRITQDRTDKLGDDAVKDGVPAVDGAVAIGAGDALSLREGTIYADGVRGVLRATKGAGLAQPLALFSKQADFHGASPGLPATGEHIVYADIWERPVYPLEDNYLADAGLHGAVTSFRTRTMTQLKSAPIAALPDIEGGAGNFPQIGSASLSVTPLNAQILADDCDPCADVVSAEQTIANALWRLEVIDVSGTPQAPGTVTLAWSVENAAAIARPDVSHEAFERAGKVYEYFSEITESHIGVFASAGDAKRSAFVDDMSTTPSPAKNHDGKNWPYVRRWDGHAVIDTNAATVTTSLGSGFTISMAGSKITLRVEAFEAELDLAGAAVVAGDYWLVELRRFAVKNDRVQLVSERPYGVVHHYCTLFRLDAGAIAAPSDAELRKLSFPAVSDFPATHTSFDNSCPKLYDDAENVQEALDKLCEISADDIAFESNCPELYDDSDNVQDALDALCKIDFSVHGSFRLLFDWGVICGLVASLAKFRSGQVRFTPGSFLDRSGRITKFKGGDFDLSALELKKEIRFDTATQLNAAFRRDEVCLALAAGEGGEVSVHVVPSRLAFGPDDPGFVERFEKCVAEKKRIDLPGKFEALPQNERRVAEKILITSTGGGALRGAAKLTEAELQLAGVFNDRMFNEFKSVATPDEVQTYQARVTQARKDNPISGQGVEKQIRNMRQATAIFGVFLESEDERLRRCLCRNLFPTCPPELGEPPFYVPIACLRGTFEGGEFTLTEVCNFCCRKQAMTWRSLQYFIGDRRDRLAASIADICCAPKDDGGGFVRPGLQFDPGKFTDISLAKLSREYQWTDTFLGETRASLTDYETKVSVNDLSEADAKKSLLGNGIEIAETFDIDDDKTFERISEKSAGVNAADQLISAGSVKPGDKVGLLLQDGVARGYVLLERGSGKLPFSAPDEKVSLADTERAKALIDATAVARKELDELAAIRATLTDEVGELRTNVEALGAERENSAAALKEVESQLSELAAARTAITREIETVNTELAAAEENRKAIVVAVREAQPVTVVTGTDDPELIAGLAAAGLTSVGDISKLTPDGINRLVQSGVIKVTAARRLQRSAATFVNRPVG